VTSIYNRVSGHDKAIAQLRVKDKIADQEMASVKAENEKLKKQNAEIKARLDRIEKRLQSK
jgi:archaellum component FlaC